MEAAMITRRSALSMFIATPALIGLSRPAFAASPPVYQEDGIAIDGSDPVAYFAGNGPVAGARDITLDWRGATWRFASDENRDRFLADPIRFAPQYGGYCAYAAAKGYVASTVPKAWTLYQDRLYLNYSKGVRRTWQKDIPGYIAKAEANWPAVLES
jgi:hypothetical protein